MNKQIKQLSYLLPSPSRKLNVAGKVVLVTGGADGIGLETARCLREQGATLAIVDRNDEAARRAASELGSAHAIAITADVTDRTAMRAAVEQVIATYGHLDVVVANAGITPPPATLRTANLDDFDRVMSVNVSGVLNTVHPAIEELIRRQGHIVVVASVAAFCPPMCGAVYMVSKAAVEQLGRALKLELAQHGVSVTVSYFGVVDTNLTKAALDQDSFGEAINRQMPAPFRKRITPREAGEVLVNAIKNRAEHSMAPKTWELFSVLRGTLNPILDRLLINDPEIQELVIELEKRITSQQTQQ